MTSDQITAYKKAHPKPAFMTRAMKPPATFLEYRFGLDGDQASTGQNRVRNPDSNWQA